MHINTTTLTAAPVKKLVSNLFGYLIDYRCNRRNFFHAKIALLLVLILACVSCGEKSPPSDLAVTPSAIDFGSSQSIAQFSIASKNAKTVLWSMSVNKPWITLSDTKGVASKTPHNINVKINRSNLSPGKRKAKIAIIYDGGKIDIPVSLFSASQSQTLVDVKPSQTNAVPIGSSRPPKNTTAANFIDGGALETNSKTVTLNISAKDHEGVSAYYINDSDNKEQALAALQSKSDWGWKTISTNKHYKGIVSYDFKRNYSTGTEVYVNVWFKGVKGGVSLVAQDNIVFVTNQVQQESELASSQEKSVIPIQENSPVSQQDSGDLSPSSLVDVVVQDNGNADVSTLVANNLVRPPGKNEGNDKEADSSETVVFSYGFENGYNGWWVDNGQWEIGTPVAGSGGSCYNSIHCAGTVLSGQYSDYIESRLISPAITIPELGDNKRIQFKFFHWYALHLHDLVKLQISVETSPGVWSDWKTLLVQSGYTRQWKLSASGLTNYANKVIRLGFYLYQPPDKAGVKEGWYIDDVSITMVR